MLTPEEAAERKAEFLEAVGWDYPAPGEPGFNWQTPRLFEISALAHQGTQELVRQIGQYLAEKKQLAAAEANQQADAAPQISETNDYSVLQPECNRCQSLLSEASERLDRVTFFHSRLPP